MQFAQCSAGHKVGVARSQSSGALQVLHDLDRSGLMIDECIASFRRFDMVWQDIKLCVLTSEV